MSKPKTKIIVHRSKKNKQWLTTLHVGPNIIMTSGETYSRKTSPERVIINLIENILDKNFILEIENAKTGKMKIIPNSIFGLGAGATGGVRMTVD